MRARRLAAASLLAISATACGDLFAPAAARVRDGEIALDQIERGLDLFERTEAFRAEASDPVAADDVRRNVAQQLLTALIRRRVLRPIARDMGIEVSDEDVEDRFGGYEEADPVLEPLLREIARDDVIEEEIKAEVTSDVEVDDEQIADYYAEHPEEFAARHIAHILVERQDEAIRLRDRLEDAPPGRIEKLFAELARKHSIDTPSARQGGDLGFSSPGQFVEPFEDAVAQLEPGEISAPVRTQFGVHIIRLIDVEQQEFDEVKERIEEQVTGALQEEAWAEWLEDAYGDAGIAVNPRFGEFDPDSMRVVDAGAEEIPGVEDPPPATRGPALSPPG